MLCKSIAACSQTSSYLGGSTTSQPRFNIIFVLALLVAQHCWCKIKIGSSRCWHPGMWMLGVQEAMLCKSITACSQTSSYLGGSTTSQPRFNICFGTAGCAALLVQNKNRLHLTLENIAADTQGSASFCWSQIKALHADTRTRVPSKVMSYIDEWSHVSLNLQKAVEATL